MKTKLTKKNWIWFLSAVLSLVAFGVLLLLFNGLPKKLEPQQMAERWSDKKDVAQISVFFSDNAGVTPDSLIGFGYTLDEKLKEASITGSSENPNARMCVSAFSSIGKVNLSSQKTTISVDCLGVGGDFFLFHPLKLLNGAYFSGSDVNKDYCIIDEDVAWQLFGSNDVAGQMIYYGQTPLVISGVVEREQGRMAKAAGLAHSVVYLSYEMLAGMNEVEGYTYQKINHYEIVMPNPVKGFAMQMVKDNLYADESAVEFVENSNRFSLLQCLIRLKEFGTRSMNGKAIIYPYWENIARGYEDIAGAIVCGMLLLFLYSMAVLIVLLILLWKRKTWTFMGLWSIMKDRLEEEWILIRKKRMDKKGGEKL